MIKWDTSDLMGGPVDSESWVLCCITTAHIASQLFYVDITAWVTEKITLQLIMPTSGVRTVNLFQARRTTEGILKVSCRQETKVEIGTFLERAFLKIAACNIQLIGTLTAYTIQLLDSKLSGSSDKIFNANCYTLKWQLESGSLVNIYCIVQEYFEWN